MSETLMYQAMVLHSAFTSWTAAPYIEDASEMPRRIPVMLCRGDAVVLARFLEHPAVVVRYAMDNDSQRIDYGASYITDVVGLAKPIDVALLNSIARTHLPSLRIWLTRPGETDLAIFPNAPLTSDTERGTLVV
jgi:hypothetical protein